MSLSVEELLWPRIRVKADYPGNPHALGTIIQLFEETNRLVIEQLYFYRKYPHLFEELKWWQERKPEEMPEYVKTRYGSLEVKKVKGYIGCGKVIEFEENEEALALYWLPATLEEYNAYQSSIKGK